MYSNRLSQTVSTTYALIYYFFTIIYLLYPGLASVLMSKYLTGQDLLCACTLHPHTLAPCKLRLLHFDSVCSHSFHLKTLTHGLTLALVLLLDNTVYYGWYSKLPYTTVILRCFYSTHRWRLVFALPDVSSSLPCSFSHGSTSSTVIPFFIPIRGRNNFMRFQERDC